MIDHTQKRWLGLDEDKWFRHLEATRNYFIPQISHGLLHSRAFQSLKYAPALKIFLWFHEKVVVKEIQQKKGKTRFQVMNNGELIFTYEEAKLRGLKAKHFARGLRELIAVGFIDIKRRGTNLRNDYSIFSFSNRWVDYGTERFVKMDMPVAGVQGYRGRRKAMGNCTACTHRQAVQGNGFIKCGHPRIEEIIATCHTQEPGFAKANVLGLVRKELAVQVDPEAFKRQWFNFPWRFHATDILQCNGSLD